MAQPVAMILDVDPVRWEAWLEKGRLLDRQAARQTLLAALAAVAASFGIGIYLLMGR